MSEQKVDRIEFCGGLNLSVHDWPEMKCGPENYERLLLPFVGREVDIQVVGPACAAGMGVLRKVEVKVDHEVERGHHGSLQFRFVISEREEREHPATQTISVVADRWSSVYIGDEGEIEFGLNSGEVRVTPKVDLPLAEGVPVVL
ncbi:MAG: hypothetical protein R2725_06865 [Solirubrobacterales bacterium]